MRATTSASTSSTSFLVEKVEEVRAATGDSLPRSFLVARGLSTLNDFARVTVDDVVSTVCRTNVVSDRDFLPPPFNR